MATRPTTPQTLGPEVASHIADLISRIEAAEGTARLGDLAEELSAHYRALAICVLADDADAEVFFRWLVHSALTRLHFLEAVGKRGLGEPRHSRVSFVAPVLDAMAARQWQLATDIGRSCASSWLEGWEYEDDFCYGDFLRRVAFGVDAGAPELLKRWRTALEGGQDHRLDVAAALVEKDSGEFEAALRGLLQHNELDAKRMADPLSGSVLSSDYPFFPNRWISVEGLALLAAAERRGMPVDYALDGCPQIARVSMTAPFQAVSYPYRALR